MFVSWQTYFHLPSEYNKKCRHNLYFLDHADIQLIIITLLLSEEERCHFLERTTPGKELVCSTF